MIKVCIATHGELCVGLLKTLNIFINDTSAIEAIPFYGEGDIDGEVILKKYIDEVGTEPTLIFTDILWGSVNQITTRYALGKPNVHVITGVNLPLVLELITMDEKDITNEEIQNRVNNCKESLVYVNNFKVENLEGDE